MKPSLKIALASVAATALALSLAPSAGSAVPASEPTAVARTASWIAGGTAHTYVDTGLYMNYSDAQAYVASHTYKGDNGHLPTVNSSAEGAAIAPLLAGLDDFKGAWMALADTVHDESGTPPRAWTWTAGPEAETTIETCSAWTGSESCELTDEYYTNWSGNQPDNYNDIESVGEIYGADASWNDIFPEKLNRVVIEFETPAPAINLLAAAPAADVALITDYNTTHQSNGSEWYRTNGNSFGFAAAGQQIFQNSADVNGAGMYGGDNSPGSEYRLSWHVNGAGDNQVFNGGWRVGASVNLNGSTDAWRIMYTSDSPTYYPSGPQLNVDQGDVINGGWTICFAQPYNTSGTNVAAALAKCDGDYILVAGITGVVGGPFGAPSSTNPADAPTDVAAVAGDGQATVSWDAPANDGGAAIDYYTVTADPGGATCTATAPETSCTITGLTNLTAYTFTVTAHNSAGTSDASSASAAIFPHTADFQVMVEHRTLAIGGTTTVHVWGAAAGKAINLVAGGQRYALTANSHGDAVQSVTFNANPGTRVLVGKAIKVAASTRKNGSVVSASAAIYVPKMTMRAKFRQGHPIQAIGRSIAPGARAVFTVVRKSDGNSSTLCEIDVDDSSMATCQGTAPLAANYSLVMSVDGTTMATNDFSVTAPSGNR